MESFQDQALEEALVLAYAREVVPLASRLRRLGRQALEGWQSIPAAWRTAIQVSAAVLVTAGLAAYGVRSFQHIHSARGIVKLASLIFVFGAVSIDDLWNLVFEKQGRQSELADEIETAQARIATAEQDLRAARAGLDNVGHPIRERLIVLQGRLQKMELSVAGSQRLAAQMRSMNDIPAAEGIEKGIEQRLAGVQAEIEAAKAELQEALDIAVKPHETALAGAKAQLASLLEETRRITPELAELDRQIHEAAEPARTAQAPAAEPQKVAAPAPAGPKKVSDAQLDEILSHFEEPARSSTRALLQSARDDEKPRVELEIAALIANLKDDIKPDKARIVLTDLQRRGMPFTTLKRAAIWKPLMNAAEDSLVRIQYVSEVLSDFQEYMNREYMLFQFDKGRTLEPAVRAIRLANNTPEGLVTSWDLEVMQKLLVGLYKDKNIGLKSVQKNLKADLDARVLEHKREFEKKQQQQKGQRVEDMERKIQATVAAIRDPSIADNPAKRAKAAQVLRDLLAVGMDPVYLEQAANWRYINQAAESILERFGFLEQVTTDISGYVPGKQEADEKLPNWMILDFTLDRTEATARLVRTIYRKESGWVRVPSQLFRELLRLNTDILGAIIQIAREEGSPIERAADLIPLYRELNNAGTAEWARILSEPPAKQKSDKEMNRSHKPILSQAYGWHETKTLEVLRGLYRGLGRPKAAPGVAVPGTPGRTPETAEDTSQTRQAIDEAIRIDLDGLQKRRTIIDQKLLKIPYQLRERGYEFAVQLYKDIRMQAEASRAIFEDLDGFRPSPEVPDALKKEFFDDVFSLANQQLKAIDLIMPIIKKRSLLAASENRPFEAIMDDVARPKKLTDPQVKTLEGWALAFPEREKIKRLERDIMARMENGEMAVKVVEAIRYLISDPAFREAEREPFLKAVQTRSRVPEFRTEFARAFDAANEKSPVLPAKLDPEIKEAAEAFYDEIIDLLTRPEPVAPLDLGQVGQFQQEQEKLQRVKSESDGDKDRMRTGLLIEKLQVYERAVRDVEDAIRRYDKLLNNQYFLGIPLIPEFGRVPAERMTFGPALAKVDKRILEGDLKEFEGLAQQAIEDQVADVLSRDPPFDINLDELPRLVVVVSARILEATPGELGTRLAGDYRPQLEKAIAHELETLSRKGPRIDAVDRQILEDASIPKKLLGSYNRALRVLGLKPFELYASEVFHRIVDEFGGERKITSDISIALSQIKQALTVLRPLLGVYKKKPVRWNDVLLKGSIYRYRTSA